MQADRFRQGIVELKEELGMLIRTQDKKGIMNMDNIDTICVIENQVKYFNGGTDSIGILGDYSEEEKAIKAVDKICDFYFRCDGIFEMPQDSEV